MTDILDFSWAVRRYDGIVVVEVRGNLDVYTAPNLRDGLIDLIESQGNRQVAIDMSEVSFLDSTGLGVLVGARRRARQRGGDLILSNPLPGAFKVLEITGLTREFTILRGDAVL